MKPVGRTAQGLLSPKARVQAHTHGRMDGQTDGDTDSIPTSHFRSASDGKQQATEFRTEMTLTTEDKC